MTDANSVLVDDVLDDTHMPLPTIELAGADDSITWNERVTRTIGRYGWHAPKSLRT